MDVSTTQRQGVLSTTETKRYSYPLKFLIDEEFASDGSASELNTSDQRYEENTDTFLGPLRLFHGSVSNEVVSNDTDLFSASGAFLRAEQYLQHADLQGEQYAGLLLRAEADLRCEQADWVDNVSCH